MLKNDFFNRDTQTVAKQLLGKVICMKYRNLWLRTMIIETEAYYMNEKGSHSSQGFTEKRKALFMEPGTIYMYFARGGDSLNLSTRGKGNAVLIKSGIAYPADDQPENMISLMQQLNPVKNSDRLRHPNKLCSGQTLLCRSMNIKVADWDQKKFNKRTFYIDDVSYKPKKIIHTTRLGIPKGRDEHLPYRFIDQEYVKYCTRKPKEL